MQFALVPSVDYCHGIANVKTVAKLHPARCEPKVIRFGCHNTRRNLPANSASKRGEANFLGAFERAYFASLSSPIDSFARGREFGLNGFGRADMIWLAWRGKVESEDFCALGLRRRIQLTAIEAKLKDWRKGLIQAARYRHFSNRAILVLPPATATTAVTFMETFKALSVGLWEFDSVAGKITKHTTPRLSKPLNLQAHAQAMEMIKHRLEFS